MHTYQDVIEEYIAFMHEGLNERDFDMAWLMQDGVTHHTARQNLTILHEHFGQRVISGKFKRNFNCWIDWPPYSPDLTPCDYFLWGHLKGRNYRDRPETLDALKQAITREI